MKKLIPYLKPFRKQCILGPFFKFSEALLELLLPTLMAFMIDEGVLVNNQKIVFTYGILMILMVFIGFGFSLICQYYASIASQGFGTNMRNLLYQRIMKFTSEDLDHFGSSTLINRIGNDVLQLQVAVAMAIRLVVRSPFLVFGAVVMSFLLDAKLALILVACVPLIALSLYWFMKKTTPLYQIYQNKLDHFLSILEQNLSGVRVIRAFISQKEETKRLDDASLDLQKQMMQVARISALLNPITALLVNGAIVFLLWGGILSIPTMGIAPGTLVAFINYATQILLALVATSNLIVIFTKASASANRVNEILDVVPSMQEGCSETIDLTCDAIVMDHMSFTYPQSKQPALHNLTLCIHQHERIGVIGGTGSGKSTLAHLLHRFYDCANITLFGKRPACYTNDTLRRIITLIPQKNELFSGTIKDNLLYGKKDASDEELWEALRIAQADDFVNAYEDGILHFIEAQGTNLSGGQKQRLCIARALLKESHILIFDDSFSALDFKTDANLRKALLHRKQTQIIISQRVTTLQSCDRILVLDRGHMVGFATHQELLQTCSIYQEICASQQMDKEVA